jgi:uncharacterized Zn finger protein (UPF0148 family)
MSDFDAEAERKRLREKYEAEEESRKQTQQMSELLLKGATMTNQHCGECGSPIFSYEDQEFCPNCQRTAEAEAEDAATADASADAGATAAGGAADTEAGVTRTSEPSANTGAEPETPQAGDVAASNGVGIALADDAGESGRDRNAEREVAGDSTAGGRPDATPGSTADNNAAEPTRQAARESLLSALTRHARLAADTDEPRRATDHLKAARKAAAALDELDGS